MTGFGADYLLIDDPVNPQEAMSDTIRQSTNSEIRSTLFSRFNDYDKGRLVMIMQRLHEADPTGELLALGGYHHLAACGGGSACADQPWRKVVVYGAGRVIDAAPATVCFGRASAFFGRV